MTAFPVDEEKASWNDLLTRNLPDSKKTLLEMAALVEEAVADAVKSLKERREELARDVFDSEKADQSLSMSTVDEICMRLARPSPARRRRHALHRLGHEDRRRPGADRRPGRAISPSAPSNLIKEPLRETASRYPGNGPTAQSMVKDAIDAFVRGDESPGPAASANGTTGSIISTTRFFASS